MSLATSAPTRFRNLAEILHQLDEIPPERIRMNPTPGSATEHDLLKPDGRHCELVDGILVEKAMGSVESMLNVELLLTLAAYVKSRRLGIVLGADGMVRLLPELVRLPDIAYISWERLPGKRAPTTPILDLAPDLAVEILSRSNTKKEMKRKILEYFDAGVRMVWIIDPETRSALVYQSPKTPTKLDQTQALDGGDVLPGFALPLAELFECLDRSHDD